MDAYESSRGEHLASAIDFSDFFEKSLFDFRCRETAAVAGYMIGADATKELTVSERIMQLRLQGGANMASVSCDPKRRTPVLVADA